jgi:protein O-GlcNAc transferase
MHMQQHFKKVISFSLWGNNPKYTVGAFKNAKLAQIIYPDWICRFYIGQSTLRGSKKLIERLQSMRNVELIEMQEDGDWSGMFWRFLPASDPDIDVMISRDTDSRLTKREKAAVEEWLASDKDFHIMRDHPFHTAKVMGGMWGVRTGLLPDMDSMIKNYKKGNFWQVDQNFLSELIYERVKQHSFVHDEFFENKKFPTERETSGAFVGEVYSANEMFNSKHRNILINFIGRKK